ncbi:CDGSH iron-sulfur domain-containing protein [Microbispora sp. RL4-1S]|uniref:CDGSH iron-sulfur domain-containing protein n=1 Tax=Microbispora oryzae TaxID=2806554 RepID=A0A941ARP8_9ACTN|nr:ferritin-like domain-containing protein [Microbispora oryzae]MBP2706469.1 CDGSH iron-sulfur domain-containing protein [Microbispora oryzae]
MRDLSEAPARADLTPAEPLRSGGQGMTSPGSPDRIDTIDSLRQHLQWAIELEHATLPPYLCALYSLDPERNPEAVEVVGGVFAEEMLHLALAANLLNAVGGRPRLDTPRMLPAHPRPLPHGDRSLELSLVPFGPDALEMFLRIEQPGPPGAPAEGDGYETIGQFYAAIEAGLRGLCDRLGEQAVFSGDPARQVGAAHFRHTAGRLVTVTDLASALAALEEIVEQGEGTARGGVWDGDKDVFHPERDEVAHYYRFQELKTGRRYRRGDTPRSGPTGEAISVDFAGIHPMRRDPRLSDHPPGSAIRTAQEEFNHTYCAVLHLLERAFNGSPRLLAVATGTMYALKAQAQALMRMPDGDGTTAGPTFEYVDPELRRWSVGARQRIVVLRDGPYVVYGGVPLRRKRKIVSAEGNALTWETGEALETEDTYALCRCGHSGAKPFCDGTHAVIGFDGTETAGEQPYEELRHVHDGVGISAQRVGELCIHAAFCIGRTRPIAEMLADTGDSDVRSGVMGRIDHCPSGSYSYALERGGDTIEPDLPRAVSVLEEEDGLASALWVTGRVPVLRADGRPLETRNRMTLCRCGHSGNKPLCDGTHRKIGFREEATEPGK